MLKSCAMFDSGGRDVSSSHRALAPFAQHLGGRDRNARLTDRRRPEDRENLQGGVGSRLIQGIGCWTVDVSNGVTRDGQIGGGAAYSDSPAAWSAARNSCI